MLKSDKKVIYASVNSSIKEMVNKPIPPLSFNIIAENTVLRNSLPKRKQPLKGKAVTEKIYKDRTDMGDLSYDELCQHVKHFMEKSSDAFHDGNNVQAGYYLIVAERFSNELKIRVIF